MTSPYFNRSIIVVYFGKLNFWFIPVVDLAITVVVFAVIQLRCFRINSVIAVITIAFTHHVPVTISIHLIKT